MSTPEPPAQIPPEVPRPALSGGAGAAGVAQVVTAGSAWVAGILVARFLGPDGAGEFNVVFTLFLALTTFGGLGLPVGVAYLVARGGWPAGDALRQLHLACLVLGVLATAVGLGLTLLGQDSLFRSVPLATFALALAFLPAALAWTTSSQLALAVDDYTGYTLGALVQGGSSVLLVAVLTPILDLEGAVAAVALSNLFAAASLLWRERRIVPRPSPGWLSRTGSEIAAGTRFGLKAYLAGALQFVNLRLDLLILNAVAVGATVGHYAVAVSVTSVATLLPRALATVVLPRVAALDSSLEDREVRDAVSASSIRHTVLIVGATVLALAVVLAGVPLIYGGDFGPAVALGFILLPGVAALGVAGTFSAVIVGRGRPELTLYAVIFSTPFTVGLYLVLVPAAEAVGAALASTVSYLITAALTFVFFRRLTGVRGIRVLLPGRRELADYRGLSAALRRA